MGRIPGQLSGIWSVVKSASSLLRPIEGEVSADGRLLRADDALFRLNHRAGGSEGGTLVIPALASLAQLSIRLQMQLSRSVRVADGDENLELWVEVKPDVNLARLSIVGWQTLSVGGNSPRFDHAGGSQEYANTMIFDSALRLVRATGIAAQSLLPGDFGRTANDVLVARFEGNEQLIALRSAIDDRRAVHDLLVARQDDTGHFTVTGQPLGDDDSIGGYRLLFDPAPASSHTFVAADAVKPPAALFGKHLAPALRQPLGRIIANAETIGSELQGPIRENYALYARDIADAARHLSALVEDLGDLEAVERQDFRTAADNIDLSDVARRVAGLLALKAADHSIRIFAPDVSNLVPAVAEFRRTLQILLNLVNNAIRYSPDGTDVRIETASGQGFASVSVIDQGGGIAEDNRERIFEKFERLGRSNDGGSGLGLYISRRLARAMGGDISVSQAESGGAKFTLRLPNS
jgi:signal transduction histidine kinase